jgi:putative redox protein
MHIEGEREPGKDPSLWKNITLVFEFKGDVDKDKAEKACALSMEKYCSVSETLKRAGATINWKVVIL